MQTSKQVTIRLFYNKSNRCFYVQIGKEMLFMVNDKVVTTIQAKENIEIVHGDDIRDIQFLANEN